MRFFWIVCCSLLLTACTPLFGPDGNKKYVDHVLSAVGYASISAQQGKTIEDKRLKAMRASKLDAYRELVEQLYGIQIKSSIGLDEQKLREEATLADIDGLIRGAEVIRSYPVGDNYVTELKLDTKRMRNLENIQCAGCGSSGGGGGAIVVPTNNNAIFY